MLAPAFSLAVPPLTKKVPVNSWGWLKVSVPASDLVTAPLLTITLLMFKSPTVWMYIEPEPVVICPPLMPLLPAKARMPPALFTAVPSVRTLAIGSVPTDRVDAPALRVRLLTVVDVPNVP